MGAFDLAQLGGVTVPAEDRDDEPRLKKHFSFYMETDGVGCSFVFKKPRVPFPERFTPPNVPMDEETQFRALDPGVNNLATVTMHRLKRGENGVVIPEPDDDPAKADKISTRQWHAEAGHNDARHHHERLLDRAKEKGTDIRELQRSIPSGKTSCPRKFLEHARVAMERYGGCSTSTTSKSERPGG